MDIREMRMTVLERRMLMGMSVRFRAIHWKIVRVLMMVVVVVVMGVIQRLMRMVVAMAFREVQPYAQRHQPRRNPESRRGRFSEKGDGHALEDHLVVALQTFETDQKRVNSITAWPWIINAVSNAK